jgi:hypothetical protein
MRLHTDQDGDDFALAPPIRKMSTLITRVEFDSTIEEVVDANMKLLQHTATYQTQRRHYQWFVGVCAAGGLTVNLLGWTRVPSYAQVALAAVAAPIVGVIGFHLYGRYHDWWARRGYRSIVEEMYGTAPIHCEYELRDEMLWSRALQMEMSFPWSRLTRVQDTSGSIELWFNPGLAIVRNRAFESDDDRRAFLDAARQHLER